MKFFKPKSGSTDTNQLIFDYAEYHRDSDKHEIYRRLSSLSLYSPVVSSNFDIKPGEKQTITEGMNLALRCVNIQLLELVLFFLNKNDVRLGERFIMMSVAEAFDMVEKTNHLQGILFYNDKESYFGILRQDFDWIRSEFFPKEPEMVTVPPGHKVVAIHPVQRANFWVLESGIHIVDFGHYCNIDEFFATIGKLGESSSNPNIIWIIQNEFIEYLQSIESSSSFLMKISQILSLNPHAKNIVLPKNAIFQASFRESLIQLGGYVFSSADDNTCFVEVHKSDGSITFGMAGKPFK